MSMHYCQQGRRIPTVYVVECKRCRRHIPAGVEAFPADNIAVCCPLCDEFRRYRPAEVYLGFPDGKLDAQSRNHAEYYRLRRANHPPRHREGR